MDNKSLTHTRWNCTYHIVFIPKYRRKVLYGKIRQELIDIFKQLCAMKKVTLISGAICPDHVHMYLAIPPKLSVSEVVAYLKGKSAFLTIIQNSVEDGEKGICGHVVITLIQLGMSMKRPSKTTSKNRKIAISSTMISKEG